MNDQNQPKIGTSLLVWGVADLYFILSVTVAILFGILLPSLQKQLDLNATQLGLLGFAFFLSFGAMQFVTGNLVDSKGPRFSLSASAFTAAVGLFLLSYANHFMWAMVAQVITGIGFSIAYVGAIYLAEIWFSERQFAFFSGITQMSANCISSLVLFSMALGGAIFIDVRTITTRLGYIALILAFLLWIIVRKPPKKSPLPLRKSLFGAGLSQLFRIPQFWFCTLYFGANFGVFLAFSSLWNIPDSLAYGHTLKTATMMSATLRFGGAFGAILSGLLANYLGRRSTVAKWYSSGALCLGIVLIYGPTFPVPLTFFIMALLGFFFGGTALGFPLIAQYIPPSLKGAGFGFMTSFGYLLCAFLEYLTGFILSSLHVNNLAPTNQFKIALTPLIVILVIGWFCSMRLQESAK